MLACTCTAHAQQTGIQAGNVTVYPTLGVSVGYDDNVALSIGGTDQSSYFYLISPGVRFETGTRRSSLRLDLYANIARYEASSLDDYDDFGVSIGWLYDPTIRSTFGAGAAYSENHERRGEGLQGFIRDDDMTPVNEFSTTDFDLLYEHGADGAMGRLSLTAGYTDLEYLNNREVTSFADFEAYRFGAEFAWRVAPKTALLASARYIETEYDEQTRDNDTLFLGVGVEWDATAKTSGRVEVGHQDVDYFGPDQADYSGSYWRAGVEWRPREYSMFEMSTGRQSDSGFGQSTNVVRESLEVAWRHQWRTRLGTVVDVGFAEESLRPTGRKDELRSFGIGVNYQFRRRILFGVGYSYFERDSDAEDFDYERNQILFTTELSY
ncbi:MAG: outer membrane beta-barrel protein [Pseudomonadota bacterium]